MSQEKIHKQLKLSLEGVRQKQAEVSAVRRRIMIRMVQEGVLPPLKLHTLWDAQRIKDEMVRYRQENNLTAKEIGDIVSWFITGEG